MGARVLICSDEVRGDALEELFRKADFDNDMKLNANERKALRESLENKKVGRVLFNKFPFNEAPSLVFSQNATWSFIEYSCLTVSRTTLSKTGHIPHPVHNNVP